MNEKTSINQLFMVAYHYPPLGGIGALRPLYFSKYLPNHNWHADILTVANEDAYPRDRTLLDLIPKNQAIYRAYRLPIFKTMRYFARKKLREYPLLYSFLDSYFDWVPFARMIGLKAIRAKNYSVIYATAPPYSSLRVAATLKEQTKLPIIADLRDPFVDNKFAKWPSRLHKIFYTTYECKLLRKMDKIVVVNEVMQQQVMRRTGFSEEDVVVIPNGFDSDKISKIHGNPPKDKLVLGYVGSIYGELNPYPIFEAAKYAISKRPDIKDKIILGFMGQMNEDLIKYEAKKAGVEEILELHGNQPHEKALAYMKSCHALLLVGGMAIQEAIPAKLFEYAATGHPVLSFSKTGLLEDFIIQEEMGFSVDGDLPQEGGELIIEIFDEFLQNGEVKTLDTRNLAKYTRKVLTSHLADVINSLN